MSFKNKVVLISGSGSGIGEAAALIFAKEGADVVIVDINEETANKTAENCKVFKNRVLVIKTDVTKFSEAQNAIEKTMKTFGKLDVLVNNAGMAKEGNLLSGTIMNTFDAVLDTNLRSVVLMTSLATPHLIKTKGCIVNTSSVASTSTKMGVCYPAYAIAKSGVDCFTRLSAAELASSGVRVNAVSPGPVLTNVMQNSGLSGNVADHASTTALGKTSDPVEIGDMIVYLASDKAKSITGCNYPVDNGMNLM